MTLREIRFLYALVAAAGARALGWCLARRIFPSQYAARQRTIRHHTQTVVRAGWQDFDLRLTVKEVVIRLAHGGGRHAELLTQSHHFCDAPAAEVGQAEAANLAGAYQVAQRSHGFAQVLIVVVAVQVKDV